MTTNEEHEAHLAAAIERAETKLAVFAEIVRAGATPAELADASWAIVEKCGCIHNFGGLSLTLAIDAAHEYRRSGKSQFFAVAPEVLAEDPPVVLALRMVAAAGNNDEDTLKALASTGPLAGPHEDDLLELLAAQFEVYADAILKSKK